MRQYRDCDSPQKRQKMAWKMYKTYVAIGAPHELNLDILSRKVTVRKIEQLPRILI